eukprot:CAMPEP_0202377220 /NCGR_PEP_ID=MMETSP1127-20130417/8572_1 /ASSEMBLY_ACC=CAM_ASM_000462 /TAXON_ID=3047 /ORGANISM="Dunaliella tertiolecta, Strain CCMP1320" /LENGTH=195 /DNA_ID=CAMNT_0048975187 /DNA_START=556 /DNA_END=1144 /DNA_ORIENTATION=+
MAASDPRQLGAAGACPVPVRDEPHAPADDELHARFVHQRAAADGEGDNCSRVCLAFSRHTPSGRCLPDGSLLYAAAALRKQQPQKHQGPQQLKQEQQHHHHLQDQELEWRWPDSSVVEEGLFECATCGDADEGKEEAHQHAAPQEEALSQSLRASAGDEGTDESCHRPPDGCASSCPSSLSFVWPASIMMRWGWL